MLKLLGFFMPGGWILSALSSVFSIVTTFLGWLMADIADAFKEPHRLIVRVVCGMLILGMGVHIGHNDRDEEVKKWRRAHAQLMEDARKADADNKTKLAVALKAKADAEAAVVAPVPAPDQPKRVRAKQRPAAGKDSASGQSLSGFFGLPGQFK